MDDGMLDIFNTQEIVNKFNDDKANNIKMLEKNFLP